jgi:polyhydroxyalkanoate synthesis regulator phasin
MNEKVKKFTELCYISRTEGLTMEQHLEKKKLADEMVIEGLMTHNGQYNFVNDVDKQFFQEMIEKSKQNDNLI